MITRRPADSRGHFDHGWLKTYHTFSFADYHDPANMGFRHLRVINEDWVAPGMGFGTHPHRDMEIITYILEGALEHKDSMGNGSTIRPGDVQRMSAGTGVFHSEFNPSPSEEVHLLQIWLFPNKRGITPSYEQIFVGREERANALRLIAGPDAPAAGAPASVTINQDARMYASLLSKDASVSHILAPGRFGFVQVAGGSITINGIELAHGDTAEIQAESLLTITGTSDGTSEFVLFDLV